MKYLPVFLKLEGRPCLVVGGGKVAARKVAMLLRAGAKISLVAPALCDELEKLRESGRILYTGREFRDEDIDGMVLAIAATDNESVNRQVSVVADSHRIPVNVVDTPKLCSFIVPSLVDRSPVQVAVSTGGASPVLARLLRARLESFIPSAYGRLAVLVDEFRHKVKQRFSDSTQRRYFWENVLQGRVAELLFAGREHEARAALEEAIADTDQNYDTTGEVYLVGAGPGDPDLITFRALRLMQQADVVVYDRLVSRPILDMVRRDAELIYAGKERDKHTLSQESINELLVRLAREGNRVLRLKGGDPSFSAAAARKSKRLRSRAYPFRWFPASLPPRGARPMPASP